MEDDFEFETPSDKYARVMLWLRAIQRSRDPGRFLGGMHFLSPCLDDLHTPLGVGVDAKNLRVMSDGPEHAYDLQEKYPFLKVACGNPVEIIKENRRSFSSIHMTYEEGFTERIVNEVMQLVQHGARDNAMLGVNISLKAARFDTPCKEPDFEPEGHDGLFNLLAESQLVLLHYHLTRNSPDVKVQMAAGMLEEGLESPVPRVLLSQAYAIRQGYDLGEITFGVDVLQVVEFTRRLQTALGLLRAAAHLSGVFFCESDSVLLLFQLERFPKTLMLRKFLAHVLAMLREMKSIKTLHLELTEEELAESVLSYFDHAVEHNELEHDRHFLPVATTWAVSPERIKEWKRKSATQESP